MSRARTITALSAILALSSSSLASLAMAAPTDPATPSPVASSPVASSSAPASTAASTTAAASTVAPTTAAPTTVKPTSAAPTTAKATIQPKLAIAPATQTASAATTAPAIIAQIGTTGHYAYQVQGFLVGVGLLQANLRDGYYGEVTAKAVSTFQARNGLPQTGKVDQATFDKLQAQWRAAVLAEKTIIAQPGTTGHYAWQVEGFLVKIGLLSSGQRDGVYDAATVKAVKTFQSQNALTQTGTVNQPTYDKLQAAYRRAVAQEQVIIAKPGTTGHYAYQVQGFLVTIGLLKADQRTGYYGSATTAAVKTFQARHGLTQTGNVDQRTFDKLQSEYRRILSMTDVQKYGLDSRCDDEAKVLCADQSRRKVWYLENGKVVKSFDARFGASSTPTRNGKWRIASKNANEWSYLYNVRMPYAMYFSGGEAFHYSADFAQIGWNNSRGGSHGCINLRDYNNWGWVFNRVPVGTLAIVTA